MTASDELTRSRWGSEGFALVGVLLALILLSLFAAAGFMLASREAMVAESHRDAAHAWLAAEAGLADVLATTVGPPPPERVAGLVESPATVSALLLVHAPGGEPVHLLRSAAAGDSRQRAVREVERLALSVSLLGPIPAAIASVGPVVGGAGGARVSGRDASAGSPCPAPPGDVAGLAVRPGDAAGLDAGTVLEGSPPLSESPEPTGPAVVDGPALFDELSSVSDGTPAIRILEGDAVLGAEGSGQGLLVARGDLVLEDGFRWAGIVMAGGKLSLRGGPTVRGAALAGVGASPGGAAEPSVVDLGEGLGEVRYDRCEVASARLAASRLRSLAGSWAEIF